MTPKPYPPPDQREGCECKGNPVLQTFCRHGHVTECHYPMACEEAQCSHYAAQMEADAEPDHLGNHAEAIIMDDIGAKTNGYQKYLEYQFHQSGGFYSSLFQAIQQADEHNMERLRAGFPEEVDAYLTWAYQGRDAFLAKCGDHPLVERMRSE